MISELAGVSLSEGMQGVPEMMEGLMIVMWALECIGMIWDVCTKGLAWSCRVVMGIDGWRGKD